MSNYNLDDPVELLCALTEINSVNSTLVPGAPGESEIATFIGKWFTDRGFEVTRLRRHTWSAIDCCLQQRCDQLEKDYAQRPHRYRHRCKLRRRRLQGSSQRWKCLWPRNFRYERWACWTNDRSSSRSSTRNHRASNCCCSL
jgi:hypothetical protein